MLSREEFIEKHRHELAGMVMDGITKGMETGIAGSQLVQFLRPIMRKIDTRLGQIYSEMSAKERIVDQTKTG